MQKHSRNLKAFSMMSLPVHLRTIPSDGYIKHSLITTERPKTIFRQRMKCDPLYPHPYYHLAALLMDMGRLEELNRHLEKCLTINTIEKSWVYGRYALIEESQMKFDKAIVYFEKAILSSQNDEKIKDYKLDIERCEMKMDIQGRH